MTTAIKAMATCAEEAQTKRQLLPNRENDNDLQKLDLNTKL